MSRAWEDWLDVVVSGIRFGPDQREVRAELEGHLEDKIADLRRIFPDIPEEEAQERALTSMGDPEEVRAELAKVHRPWLGWLWMASRVVWLLWIFTFLIVLGVDATADNSLWGRTEDEIYGRISDGQRAELGGYTFQITAAACLDVPEDGLRTDVLQLVLRASSPRFWAPAGQYRLWSAVTAVGPEGARCTLDGATVRSDPERGVCQLQTGVRLCRWTPFWREFAIYIPAEGWRPGDRVTLEFDSELGALALSVPVTERVVVP